MSSEEYASLLAKVQGNDVDAKIDAVGKLQPLLDTEGFELTEIDDLIAALKVCLRIANQHLTTATLLLLPSLLRHLSSNAAQLHHEIRFAFASFLPPGGILDRLGDTRDRARDAAKTALVAMAGLAFEHGGASQSASLRGKEAHRGPETPMMIFEKAFRDNGFGSKITRVREQSIQCLVMIREAHPGFPLRPYVSRSVELLEDGDGAVRDAAKGAVITLFTAPGVTDAARADLKNEMSKRGVRKGIVEAVLSKLVGSGSVRAASVAGSDSGVNTDTEVLSRPGTSTSRRPVGTPIARTTSITSAGGSTTGAERPLSREDAVPPQASSSGVTLTIPAVPPLPAGIKSAETGGVSATSTEIPVVFIASARDLEHEMEKMLPFFEGKETEHNWAGRERSVITIRGLIKGGVHARYPEVFLEGLKNGVLDGTLKALASLRTTVSSHACVLYAEMAEALEHNMDPYVDRVLTPLLKMSGFTKKIVAQQSQATVSTIISKTSAPSRVVLPLIWSYVQEKNVQSRSYVIEHLTTYLRAHALKAKHAIEAAGGVDTITKCLQRGLSDPNPGVRTLARTCFWTFEPVWPANALVIAEQLDITARKQLDKANPVPGATTPVTPVEETKKKPSVAAAIAASRAKAKAIATAPPTLRHAVTSPPARRAVSPPPAKTPAPVRQPTSPRVPSTSGRPSSRPPSRAAGSPGAPSPPRDAIPPVPPLTTPRPASRESTPSPPSPTSSSGSHRRQVSTASAAQSSSPGRPSTLRSSYSQIRPGAKAAATNGSSTRIVPSTVPPPPRAKSPSLSKSTSAVPRLPSSPRRATSPTTPTSRRVTPGNGSPVSRKPLPAPPLPSLDQMIDNSDSLLHAATVPIPDDDDDDESMNMISFSTPYEKYPPTSSSAVSSTMVGDMQEPEESLLAKAIQATSAASQLEDEMSSGKDYPSPYPAELLAQRQNQTPLNRKIMREAALFQDSPQATKTPTILDHLFDQMHENGSWVHRRSLSLRQASVDLDFESTSLSADLRRNIDALVEGAADETVLRRLAVICAENGHSSVIDLATNGQGSPELVPSSPTRTNGGSLARPLTSPTDVWLGGKTFDKLFDALTGFLTHEKSVEILDLGLAVFWEMLRHQWDYITEHQLELWAFLIRLRYANNEQVLQGTNAIRDALTAAVEPVFGLTTANGCLLAFLAEAPPSPDLEAVRVNSWAYGLVGMAKLVMRFPPDILEEEIPRIRSTLTTAICYEPSTLVRGAATVAIAACQLVLRDETHLFTLLGNLPNEKKNLLTYYFNRTGSRGPAGSRVEAGKVDEEIRKIDRGTTLPPRKPVVREATPTGGS